MSVSRINWSKIASAVASHQQTYASLSAFRKQYSDLKRELSVLEGQKTTVDFDHYRKLLNNKDVVSYLERTLKTFKPVDYNVEEQKKVINKFEAKALSKAENFAALIEEEVASLKDTLVNIEKSRPVEELYTDDVIEAFPEVEDVDSALTKLGQWPRPELSEKIPPIPLF